MTCADKLLRSNSIFTGTKLIDGYIAIKDSQILSVGEGNGNNLIGSSTTVLDFPGKTITSGFIDSHCFFSGHMLLSIGINGDDCSPEEFRTELSKCLSDKVFSKQAYLDYMAMMNSRGITGLKDMAFDDYDGFTNVLEELHEEGKLSLRSHFMSQPVSSSLNLDFGNDVREKLNSMDLRFSGYNRMTDGSLSVHEGDLKSFYSDKASSCDLNIDYDAIEQEVLAADENGFRFALHTQGDAAISKAIKIFDKCQKDLTGKLLNKHVLTDLEFSDAEDFKKMSELGIIGEIYPQIMSLYVSEDKLKMIQNRVGDRMICYWNRRAMIDKGVILSCSTDLPLLYPNIPESIHNACFGLFNDSNIPFNPKNTLTISELLYAWTMGGAINLGIESITGSIEAGKSADIVIMSNDLFSFSDQEILKVDVEMTYFKGRVVYCKNT